MNEEVGLTESIASKINEYEHLAVFGFGQPLNVLNVLNLDNIMHVDKPCARHIPVQNSGLTLWMTRTFFLGLVLSEDFIRFSVYGRGHPKIFAAFPVCKGWILLHSQANYKFIPIQ